jgi:hypothetical protein
METKDIFGSEDLRVFTMRIMVMQFGERPEEHSASIFKIER